MIFAHRKPKLLYQTSNLIKSQSLVRLIRLLCRIKEGDYRGRNAPSPTDSHHVAHHYFWNDPDCAGIGRRRRSVAVIRRGSGRRFDHFDFFNLDYYSMCVLAGGSAKPKSLRNSGTNFSNPNNRHKKNLDNNNIF